MSLYEQWNAICNEQRTNEQAQVFWSGYFAAEQKNYEAILSEPDKMPEGTVKELAERYSMKPEFFLGFLDGINSSLKQELELESLEEDSQIKLDIDLEKLYFNMLEAKAKWLYTLPQWDEILTEEKRKEITRNWRLSKQAVSHKVGRNDPCPCGSGKKYKHCCGA